jgi:hypothetical protein
VFEIRVLRGLFKAKKGKLTQALRKCYNELYGFSILIQIIRMLEYGKLGCRSTGRGFGKNT